MATSPNYSWPEPDNTDLVKNGALAMRTLGNAIDTTMATMTPKSTVTAKGSLIAATAASTPANLAVGNNGETLVADSSTATGLRYTSNFAAGKNKIINGDFLINQRAFSSTTTSGAYMFDRWSNYLSDGTVTYSSQSFTLGTAPVTGYEGTTFIRCVTSGQTATGAAALLFQKIESVRTFANQTVTVSFWAKAGTGTPKIALELGQNFGSGGSASVNNYLGQVTLSTSWIRYSATIALPSIAGKTVGTSDNLGVNFWTSAGSDFNSRTGSLGIQSATIDIWGVQVEAGSVATAFQTATGTIQGELAACQRYYQRFGTGLANARTGFIMGASSTTQLYASKSLPVTLRTNPTSIDYSTLGLTDGVNATVAVTTAALNSADNQTPNVLFTVASGLTQFRTYEVINNNNAAGYIGISAEL